MKCYVPSDADLARVADAHKFHAADSDKKDQHEEVRRVTGMAAIDLMHLCPPSRELSLALTKIQEAMYWANAAIAIHQKAT